MTETPRIVASDAEKRTAITALNTSRDSDDAGV